MSVTQLQIPSFLTDKHSMILVPYLKIIGLILLVSVSACTTGPVAVHSWVGKPESELLKKWGTPDHTGQFQNGGKVHTWIITEKGEFGSFTCRRSVTVDESGTVTKGVLSGCPLGYADSQ